MKLHVTTLHFLSRIIRSEALVYIFIFFQNSRFMEIIPHNWKDNFQHHILSNDDMIHTYVNRMTRMNWTTTMTGVTGMTRITAITGITVITVMARVIEMTRVTDNKND